MNNVLVTIVTVTYNCEKEIEDTIKSVICQDYPFIEYIVIDGKSSDKTLEIVNKYKAHISKIVSEPDKGIYDAMNKAISLASGTWLNFMNAGDCFEDSSVVSNLFTNLPSGKKVIYGKTKYVNQDNSYTWHDTADISHLKQTFSRWQPYVHQSVFYEISTKSDSIFDLRYKIEADYDVACRYWNKYGIGAFHYVPICICRYKAYDGLSSDVRNKKICSKESIIIRIRNKMNWIPILKSVIRYIIK